MITFYTKDQAKHVLRAWGQSDKELPRKKGEALVIVFPKPNPVVTITKSKQKSTDGKTLYGFHFETKEENERCTKPR